jgi:hypothetical protein
MSFFREIEIRSARRARPCGGCGKQIEIGEPALDLAGHYQGDFWSAAYHRECRAAEVDLNDQHQAEEWIPLADCEADDWAYLLEEHPVAAARLGVTLERIEAERERERRAREGWRQRWQAVASALRVVE